MKIGVIGIGALGGYISAMLSRTNEEICIIADSIAKNNIKNNGITLNSEVHGNFCAHPHLVSNDPYKLGKMDVIFVCVKGSSLKYVAKTIAPMVDEYTIIVPFGAGVDSGSRLYSYLGKGKILESVVYIRARSLEPGVIIHKNYNTRFIISSNKRRPVYEINLEIVYNLLIKAGINCEIKEDVEAEAWNKYVFNCAFNITDSYYDVGVKGILEDRMKFETFCNIAKECENVGRSKGVNLHKNIHGATIRYLKQLSKWTISSMHNDLIHGRKIEIEQYCGDLCRMGEEVGVSTPYSRMVYNKLKSLQTA